MENKWLIETWGMLDPRHVRVSVDGVELPMTVREFKVEGNSSGQVLVLCIVADNVELKRWQEDKM